MGRNFFAAFALSVVGTGVGFYGGVLAQSALTQLGLTEAAARELVLGDLRTGGRDGATGKLSVAGLAAYVKVPEAARGPVTTDLVRWAKAYLTSPAVATGYARMRTDARPERKQYPRTIDEEIKKQVDDVLAAHEQSRQMAASLPAADREKLLASLKAIEASMATPAVQQGQRAAVEAERAQQKAKEDEAFSWWEQQFPADLQVLFARRLREFLAATADVDFETRSKVLRGLGGEIVGFPEPSGYAEKPWQWQRAFVVGPAATMAARAAAEEWLKEIAR